MQGQLEEDHRWEAKGNEATAGKMTAHRARRETVTLTWFLRLEEPRVTGENARIPRGSGSGKQFNVSRRRRISMYLSPAGEVVHDRPSP